MARHTIPSLCLLHLKRWAWKEAERVILRLWFQRTQPERTSQHYQSPGQHFQSSRQHCLSARRHCQSARQYCQYAGQRIYQSAGQHWQSGPVLSGYACPVFRQHVTQNNIHTKSLMWLSGQLLGYACVQTAHYPEQHTHQVPDVTVWTTLRVCMMCSDSTLPRTTYTPSLWCDRLDHCCQGMHDTYSDSMLSRTTLSMAINSNINVHSPT